MHLGRHAHIIAAHTPRHTSSHISTRAQPNRGSETRAWQRANRKHTHAHTIAEHTPHRHIHVHIISTQPRAAKAGLGNSCLAQYRSSGGGSGALCAESTAPARRGASLSQVLQSTPHKQTHSHKQAHTHTHTHTRTHTHIRTYTHAQTHTHTHTHTSTDKGDTATYEGALDRNTRMILFKMINTGLLAKVCMCAIFFCVGGCVRASVCERVCVCMCSCVCAAFAAFSLRA